MSNDRMKNAERAVYAALHECIIANDQTLADAITRFSNALGTFAFVLLSQEPGEVWTPYTAKVKLLRGSDCN